MIDIYNNIKFINISFIKIFFKTLKTMNINIYNDYKLRDTSIGSRWK